MARETHEQRLLSYLQDYKSATVRDIMNRLNINSPTKVISNLRKAGHDIRSIQRRNENTGTRYVEYYLKET